MGGCCCSSQRYQLHGTPVYYYCPPALEEHESLTSHDGQLSTGVLVDLNLDTSIPDTYRSPPTPIPFDVVLGVPQSANTESIGHTCGGSSFEKVVCLNLESLDCKPEDNTFLSSPKNIGSEFQKSTFYNVLATVEEDFCPTCLEDYDADNPRITTKCNHQFHLSCILDWMERSDTCPICNQKAEDWKKKVLQILKIEEHMKMVEILRPAIGMVLKTLEGVLMIKMYNSPGILANSPSSL